MPQIPTALLTTIGATTNTTNMTIVTGKDEYKYTQANELTSRYVKKVGDNEFFTADNLYYRGTTNDKPDEENAATAYIPITSINDFLNKSKVDNYAFAH